MARLRWMQRQRKAAVVIVKVELFSVSAHTGRSKTQGNRPEPWKLRQRSLVVGVGITETSVRQCERFTALFRASLECGDLCAQRNGRGVEAQLGINVIPNQVAAGGGPSRDRYEVDQHL